MGTEKRQRQKAGRQARIEAAQVAQKKADGRRRITTMVAIVGVVVVIGVVIALLGRGKDKDKTETATSDSTVTTPVETPDSAAGKDCVAFSDTLPSGAPEVPITPGPPPSELVIEDLVEGSGDPVPEGATVTVDYIGVSCSTGKIFDSSWTRGDPATFPLSEVIPGWTQGIPGMKPGGQRLLIIPPDLGYGSTGSPPSIAPNETLYFVVDLVSFEGSAQTAGAGTSAGPDGTVDGDASTATSVGSTGN